MERGRLAAGLTAAALLVALGAVGADASGDPAAPTTLDVAIPGPFHGCDPGSPATSSATDAVLSLVLPSAFTTGPSGLPVGDTSAISQAELVATQPQTVVYQIAPGASWPSGRPLVAADLVRTWHERRRDRVLADLGYRDVAAVVTGTTPATVTVTFRAAYSDWESLFDLVIPGPTAAARCALPTASLDPSIGPYAIVTSSATRITLEANPLWPDPPRFPRVVVTSDPATMATRSAAPTLEYLPSPSLTALQDLTSRGTTASAAVHTTTVVALDFAVHGPRALRLDVRRGVAALVDRQALVDQFAVPVDATAAVEDSHLFGQGDPSYLGPVGTGVTPPASLPAGASGSTGAAAYPGQGDPAAADAWLRAAGLVRAVRGWSEGGVPLDLCLAAPTDDAQLSAVARALASQLHAAGVSVTLDPAPNVGTVVARLRAGACGSGVAWVTGDGYATHAAARWLRPRAPVPDDLAWTGVADPVMTAASAVATAVLNPVTAATAWASADDRLWTLMAGLPLYSPSAYLAWSPSVVGVTPCVTVAGCIGEVPMLLTSPTRS